MKRVGVLTVCLMLLSVVRGKDVCEVGDGLLSPILSSGTCAKKITTESECREAARINKELGFDNNGGYAARSGGHGIAPYGCFSNSKYWFNPTKSSRKCDSGAREYGYKCICKSAECTVCPINTYSTGGINPKCKPCPGDKPTTNFKTGQTKCVPVKTVKITCGAGQHLTGDGINTKIECRKCPLNTYKGKVDKKCIPCPKHLRAPSGALRCVEQYSPEWVEWRLRNIDIILDSQKEERNEIVFRNSRLWQKENIRLQYDKITQERKTIDNNHERLLCQSERSEGTVVFPAIEISSEIETKQDTTCIDTNRDELLKSFCSFRMDLDSLFQIQGIDTPAKSFWPNICCKERNDDDKSKTLETCQPPEGSNIKPENMIPFALSQGGYYNRHNLYVEVTEAIKKEGYLHQGMKDLLASLQSSVDTTSATKRMDAFFNGVSLCGPRIVDAPGNGERKLCELFVPYHHAMKSFYTLIESLFVKPMPPQSSFLETMERSLRKRSEATRLGKSNVQQMIQTKSKAAEATCSGGSKWTSAKLEEKKRVFCLGYNHLDLSDTNIKNVAVHYLKHDISYDDKKMFELSKQLRYQVTDDSCPAPLFTANDISIQQVAMDVLGKKKEWVAVVNLNTQDKNGYLQSELPFCEERPYLIGVQIKVKAYEDVENYCGKLLDYDKCKSRCVEECQYGKKSQSSLECENSCDKKMIQLKDKRHEHYSKNVRVTGTQYTVDDSHVSRRRKLLQQGDSRC
jgi:hypothetical protein